MRRRYEFDYSESYEENDDGLPHSTRNSIHSVPFYAGIGILIYLLAVYYGAYLIDNHLPTPLTIEDETNYPDEFITERAENHLRYLTNLGPRITGGYENEVLTVNYLVKEIEQIITHANRNQLIEFDVQIVNGSYILSDGIVSYSSVKNVVVKLHGNSNSSRNSLLLNVHFDSVPTSPGGSDDGINCAALLEILHKLSRSHTRLENDVIFLFNGAEETPLQASHGFITQHKWAADCKVLINLEAAGAGGKIVLFQTGPNAPWLVKYYQMVPHPYGQVAGEEIFQSGIIPSDTDFRIFRDYGNLVGVDMAFYKDGYRYHTKYDGFDNIPMGSLQHVGDNTLSLVRNIANSEELSSGNRVEMKESAVYFDILGVFFIVYNITVATVLNLAVSVLSILLFIYNMAQLKLGYTTGTLKYTAITLLSIISGWIGAFIAVFVIATLVDQFNLSMSWYGKPWLIFGLYVTPVIAITCGSIRFLNHENLSLNVRTYVQTNLVRLIWTVLFIVGTLLQIRSSYAFLVLILFHSLAFVVISVFQLQHTKWKWQCIYIVFLLVPTLLLMYQTHVTFSLFIPITGRIGSNKNPEVIIGLIAAFFTILITSFYVALTSLMKNSKLFFAFLAVVFVGTLITIATPFGFPYSGDPDAPTPQRQWILHTSRMFYNEDTVMTQKDAGILFINMDRNSPRSLKPYIKDLAKAKPAECDKYVLCGFPLPHPKIVQIMEWSTWIPANQPKFNVPVNVQFTSNVLQSSPESKMRYDFSISGPDRIFIYILPKDKSKVTRISTVNELPKPKFRFHDRPIYYILHTFGDQDDEFRFEVDVEAAGTNVSKHLDVVVTGAYVHDRLNPKTPYFQDVIKQFPDWADVTPMLGVYQSFSL